MFLKIAQNSHENTCVGVSFLIKWYPWDLQFYQKRLRHRCFPVNVAKLLRTPFHIELLRCLLLDWIISSQALKHPLGYLVYISLNFYSSHFKKSQNILQRLLLASPSHANWKEFQSGVARDSKNRKALFRIPLMH